MQIFFSLLLLTTLWTPLVWAQSSGKEMDLIEENQKISTELDKTADFIDRLFTGKETAEEKSNSKKRVNRTTLRIRLGMNLLEGEDPEFSERFDLRLHLPKFEERIKMKFTNYSEDSEERGIERNRLDIEEEEEEFGASFALFEYFGKVKTRFRPRLEYNDGALETSHILRINTSADFKWIRFLPGLELFGRSDTGTGQFIALNFAIPINLKTIISIINEQQYESFEHLFSVTHGARIAYFYNDTYNYNLGINFEYDNKPAYSLDRYTINLTLVHKLYKRVLHYELTPYLLFDEEDRFSMKSGLLFQLRFIF